MTHRRLSVYEPERAELAPGDRVRVTLYTDDAEKLPLAIQRERSKDAGLDLARA